MPHLVDTVDSSPDGPRNIGTWFWENRRITALIEWTAAPPDRPHLATVAERIPTEKSRSEEARTLKIDGLFCDGRRSALIYHCVDQPVDLHRVLTHIQKPSSHDRRALCMIILTQVRSLCVDFQICHPALRTESFVFFGDPNKPDLTKPYVLDWARQASPEMYQNIEYQAGKPLWSDQVWSLMMVISEIVEWRPLDRAFRDEAELQTRKLERKQLVTNPNWKNATTARFFKHGFGFLEKNRLTLEQYSRWDVKRFYDRLCELLTAS